MKKFISNIFKVSIAVLALVCILKISKPTNVLAFADTNKLTITFRDNYTEEQGYVEYSVNDGASWVKVTSNINNQDITMNGDNLRIRVVATGNYGVDFAGISYRENGEQPKMLNDSENASIAGALISSNGYLASSNATTVELESVEFTNNGDNQNENHEEGPFDGKAYVVWSCNEGICYHYFDNIIVNQDGTSVFYKASEVTDDKNNSIKFDVNAENKFFTSKARFEDWQEDYKTNNNTDTINWNSINIEDLIGPDGIDYQPVGEPYDNNAYVSYGDRNFKVVIYNDDFKGVSIGDLSDLNYYPASWVNPFIRTDQYDISNTTKDNPTIIKTILLEDTINIKNLNYNSFVISSIEALDVPSNAVIVTKVNNEYKIVFKSNYYDNVTFKVTDSNNEVSYFKISRYTIDAKIKFIDNKPTIRADFSFDKAKNYTDFILKAKIIYKDGTSKNIDMTAVYGIDDGLGNITNSYEFDEETDDEGGNRGKGLKKSTFEYKLSTNEEEKISKVYINVENKGSTSMTYAGAFAGSGKGIVLDLEEGE